MLCKIQPMHLFKGVKTVGGGMQDWVINGLTVTKDAH